MSFGPGGEGRSAIKEKDVPDSISDLLTNKDSGAGELEGQCCSELAAENHLHRLPGRECAGGLQHQEDAAECHCTAATAESCHHEGELGHNVLRLESTSNEYGEKFCTHSRHDSRHATGAVSQEGLSFHQAYQPERQYLSRAWLEGHPGWEVTSTKPAIPPVLLGHKDVVLVCEECRVLGTKLVCREHSHTEVPESIFNDVFGNVRYEVRLAPNGSVSVEFFLVRTTKVEERLASLGEYYSSGKGTIPPGNWAVKFSQIPLHSHLIDLLKAEIELLKFRTHKSDLSWDMTRFPSGDLERKVLLCPTRGTLGTSLSCDCKNHVTLSAGTYKRLFGHLQWVCWFGQSAQLHINFRDPGASQANCSIKEWSKCFGEATVFGSETVPIGNWEVKISKLPKLSDSYACASGIVNEFLVVKEVLETYLAKDESFHTAFSTLSDSVVTIAEGMEVGIEPTTAQLDTLGAGDCSTIAPVGGQETEQTESLAKGPRASTPVTTRVLRSHVRRLNLLESQFRPINPVAATLESDKMTEDPKV